jgi:hypothetical protein
MYRHSYRACGAALFRRLQQSRGWELRRVGLIIGRSIRKILRKVGACGVDRILHIRAAESIDFSRTNCRQSQRARGTGGGNRLDSFNGQELSFERADDIVSHSAGARSRILNCDSNGGVVDIRKIADGNLFYMQRSQKRGWRS